MLNERASLNFATFGIVCYTLDRMITLCPAFAAAPLAIRMTYDAVLNNGLECPARTALLKTLLTAAALAERNARR